MGENDIVLLFTSHSTVLAPKTWKKLSSVKNKRPAEHPQPTVPTRVIWFGKTPATGVAFPGRVVLDQGLGRSEEVEERAGSDAGDTPTRGTEVSWK